MTRILSATDATTMTHHTNSAQKIVGQSIGGADIGEKSPKYALIKSLFYPQKMTLKTTKDCIMIEYVPKDNALNNICAVIMKRFNVSANTGYEIAEEALETIYTSNLIDPINDLSFKVIDRRTMSEADIEKIALTEAWADDLTYCDMQGFAIEEDGNLILLDECGNYAYCPPGRFIIEYN